MAGRKPIVGIDLGTTNTCAAWVDDKGVVRLVPVTEHEFALPSVVWWGSRDVSLVGTNARQHMLDDPEHTVFGFKRLLGRPFRSEFVSRMRDRFPYKLVEGDGGRVAVEMHGEVKSLKDVAFLLFARVMELARGAMGTDVDQAVLTVPSHFGHAQRQIIRGAAEMAGIDVRAMVNEPTAAALYCTRGNAAPRSALVVDLGGGTLDVTLLQVQGNLVRVRGSHGDAFLGGADFDEKIAQHFARRFEQEHGINVMGQKVVYQRLLFAAETAKVLLSTADTAQVRVMFAGEKNGHPVDLDYMLDRATLEGLVAPLIERCSAPAEQVLARVGLKPADVEELILVGRAARMPALRKRMFGIFGGDPEKNPAPEMAVPAGAAMLGSMLDDIVGPPLVDAVSMPVWAVIPGEGPRAVLQANQAIPAMSRITLDKKPAAPMVIWLYEALEAASLERDMLGSVKIEPAALAAGPASLEITLTTGGALDIALKTANGARTPLELAPPRKR